MNSLQDFNIIRVALRPSLSIRPLVALPLYAFYVLIRARALPASFVVAHLIGRWRRAPHHADIMLTHGTESLQLQPSRDAFLVVDMEARQDEHTLAG